MHGSVYGWIAAILAIAGHLQAMTVAESAQEGSPIPFINKNGKFGYRNEAGKTLIRAQFDHARNFTDGLGCVQLDGKWGYIDPSGKFIIQPEYEWAYDVSQGLAQAGVGWTSYYLNVKGEVLRVVSPAERLPTELLIVKLEK
jgi:hypothetical protein